MKSLPELIAETQADIANKYINVSSQNYVLSREQMNGIVDRIMTEAAEAAIDVVFQENQEVLIDKL